MKTSKLLKLADAAANQMQDAGEAVSQGNLVLACITIGQAQGLLDALISDLRRAQLPPGFHFAGDPNVMAEAQQQDHDEFRDLYDGNIKSGRR